MPGPGSEFQRDLEAVFGSRAAEFSDELRGALFDLWTLGGKVGRAPKPQAKTSAPPSVDFASDAAIRIAQIDKMRIRDLYEP